MQECMEQFIEHTKSENLNIIYAQIRQGGQLVSEYKRMPVKTRLNTWSACKGVVSCAFGIAEAEGLINLEERVVDLFPEYACGQDNGYLSEITFHHLLTMTTGLESSLFFCDWPERYTTPDWIAYFFKNARFVKKPGTEWLYSNFNTFITSCAIEKRAGCNLLDYMRHRFFEKIEIGNPDWTLSPKGHVHAANGLYLTIDEMSHYGELIKNKGSYNGVRIVPKDYMERATSNLTANPAAKSDTCSYSGFGYGYQFVMNPEPNSYRSDGNYGQFCLAYPDQDTVITVMSLEGKFVKIGNYLWKDIIADVIG